MTANELRIGNWVQKHGEQYQCGSATIMILERDESDVQPITLSEEWLERFGFKGLKKWNPKGHDDFRYIACYPHKNEVCAIDWKDYEYVCISDSIKYVHQLQNLYFALTGQELKVKDA